MGRESFTPPEELTGEDSKDIIADQDQTSLHADPESDMRSRGGPSNLDLEDTPVEFTRGEIDVKTQMDRTTRVARASANHHYDLDDSPETTPGGLEEVIAKTDRDLKTSTKPVVPSDNMESGETEEIEAENSDGSGRQFIDIEEISEEVDLASEQLGFGEMNEEDARESGYIQDETVSKDKSEKPQTLH